MTCPTTTLEARAIEGGSYQMEITLYDVENPAVALAEANINTVTLTLVDEATETVINSQSATNIKDANNGELSEAGVLSLTLLPADNALVGTATEWHIAIIKWTFAKSINGGDVTVTGVHNFRFVCEQNKE